jgi:hypothetical protein
LNRFDTSPTKTTQLPKNFRPELKVLPKNSKALVTWGIKMAAIKMSEHNLPQLYYIIIYILKFSGRAKIALPTINKVAREE